MSTLPEDASVVGVEDDGRLYLYPVREDESVIQEAFVASDYWFELDG